MWNTPVVVTAPTVDIITLAEAKAQCRVDTDDTSFDTELSALIRSARAHVEAYCGVHFAEKTVRAQADSFADMARLPYAPVKSVVSISYIDREGDPQTVASGDYTIKTDMYEPAIRIKRGLRWPSIAPDTRITLDVVAGGVMDDDVKHAVKLLVGHWLANKESVVTGTIAVAVPMSVDALLANHRR